MRHLRSAITDAAEGLYHFDTRLFRTLGPLYLRPGRITLDYFAGRRARYVAPFRLVFFLAVIAFFGARLAATGEGVRIDVASSPPAASAPAPAAETPPFADGNIRVNGRVVWNRVEHPLELRWLPAVTNAWLNDLIGNAQAQLHRMNSGAAAERARARHEFTARMYAAAPTVLLLLLPVFALLLKLFYLFRRRLYMEHLIVAMHSHAFLMLSMLVLVALGALRELLVPRAGWLSFPLGLALFAQWMWIFAYLLLMQKRVYRQGWAPTAFKYLALGFCYTILAGCGGLLVVLMSLSGA